MLFCNYILFFNSSNQSLSLILHSENQFLDSSRSTSLSLYNKESFNTKVTYQQFIGLATTHWTEDVPEIQGQEKCSSDINYDECVYSEKEIMMRKETRQNCTVPFTHNNKRVCNNQEDMQSSFRVATRTLGKHRCPEPCRNLFINFGGKTMNLHNSRTFTGKKKSNYSDKKSGKKKYKNIRGKENSVYTASSQYNARLTFGGRVQMIEEHQLYQFINLVAESGLISLFIKQLNYYQ